MPSPTFKVKRGVGITAPTLIYGEIAYIEGADDGHGAATPGVFYYGNSSSASIPIGGPGVYASLYSPVFTGNPTAPTATTADSSLSIATTAFVTGAISNLHTTATGSFLTSVGLTAPSIFTVTGSPVTNSSGNLGAGTLNFDLNSQGANLVFAGPSSGTSASPTFRSLVATDIPYLAASIITSGTLSVAYGGTGLSSYAEGDVLYASDSADLAALHGNATATRKFLTSIGTGTVAQPPNWLVLQANDIASGVPDGIVKGVSGMIAHALPGEGNDYIAPYGSQSQNYVLAAPFNSAGVSGFRLLDPSDIPVLNASKITTGQLLLARGGTGSDLSATGGTSYFLRQSSAGANITVSGIVVADLPRLDQLTGSAHPVGGTLDMNNYRIINVADPTQDTDAANKEYVDGARAGLDVKSSCQAATVGENIDLTTGGLIMVDGYQTVAGDRILVKDQTDGTQNGIYVVATGAWLRSTDTDTNVDFQTGMFTFVNEGTVNSTSGWVLSNPDPVVIGTSIIVFTQFSGAGQITAGTGMTKTGNLLNVVGTAGTIQALAHSLTIDPTYIGQSSITTVGTLVAGVIDCGFIT